ncbi:MAG: glycosyl transferase family protein [Acidobacteria bacterium OLB17]|nr:MAG: glycosyl transferase family protein [Acidobacteria bacterium OLB17]MCZ2392194.1 glycosyltransferase family 2 protein [Acidobacteriota bacterium]
MSDLARKVAIVIPVYNRREITLQGLRSLSRIDRTGFDVRLFIVDDGSTDGTSDAIRSEFPDVIVIHGDGTLHYAAGTNRGIEAALEWDPEFIATMNDDAVFHEQFLQRLVNTADKNPHSIIGGLLLLWDEPHKVFQVGQTWKTLKGGWVIPSDWTAFTVPQTAFEAECLVGNCLLLPAAAIRECGMMDEKRFPYGWGDAQWMARFSKAGWRLLVEPKAYVWCEPNTYPKPLHQMSKGKILRTLFLDKRHPLNLSRQFSARWHSAPSRSKAVASFLVYLGQLAAKSVGFAAGAQKGGGKG